MKAMILAGGLSTRLYPLTRQVPKPLVPVAGEPISAHILRYLRSFGIEDVAINIHYHAERIKEAFGDGSRYGVRLHYLYEPKLMGSAGAVKQMEEFFAEDTFVVIGCDDLTDLDLQRLVDFHKQEDALATIALYEAAEVEQYGVVITDKDGRITDFQEKPPKGTERSHLVNTGVYCFDPKIFEDIPAGEFIDFGKNVFPALQQRNAAFYGLLMPGAYWCDVGTPPEYRRATNDVLTGRVGLRGARPNGVAHGIRRGAGVTIDGPVHLGADLRLGDGVRIVGPAVIGDRARIDAGAVIERSILWDDVTVGAGAQLRDAIVGMQYEIAPQARLNGDIVANEESATPA
jgi:mannose-1-phosphate guanylyltransferase